MITRNDKRITIWIEFSPQSIEPIEYYIKIERNTYFSYLSKMCGNEASILKSNQIDPTK